MENNYEPIIDASASPVGNDKLFAILAYIPFLWLIGLLVEPEKNHAFTKNHVNNGILCTIPAVINHVVIWNVPIIRWILGPIITLLTIVCAVYGIYKAFKGELFHIPVISRFVQIIK